MTNYNEKSKSISKQTNLETMYHYNFKVYKSSIIEEDNWASLIIYIKPEILKFKGTYHSVKVCQ